MGKIDESAAGTYDWDSGEVYLIEREDMVEGGEDGISNRQGKALAVRTRNLHDRLKALKEEAAEIAAELESLTTAVDTKDAATLEAAKADASTKSEAALRNAKSYTDTREGIVRTDYANADASTLVSAKAYADRVVAALVDGSPEALDTLQELAKALGNDPNFATTVMAEIGKRATTEAMNAALAGKFDKSGGKLSRGISVDRSIGFVADYSVDTTGAYIGLTVGGVMKGILYVTPTGLQYIDADSRNRTVWHAGNFNPDQKFGVILDGVTDLNEVPVNCFFRGLNPANAPVSGYICGFCTAADYNKNFKRMLVFSDSTAFIRIQNANTWGPWRSLYDSGNLTAATQSTNGLMSAADKQKLDGLGAGVTSKCCGKVTPDGRFAGGYGCSSVTKLSTGKYRIYHNIGNTNYAVTATIIPGENDVYDNTTMIGTTSSNYFDIWIGTGPGTLEDAAFQFITMSY